MRNDGTLKRAFSIAALSIALLLLGASGSCLFPTGSKRAELEQEVNSLKAKVEDLEKHVDVLNDAVSEATKAPADLKVKYDELREAVDVLNGQIEEIRFQLERIKPAKVQELEERIAALEAKLGAAPGGREGTVVPEEQTEEGVYRDAYALFKRGNYVAARAKFTEFLEKYPSAKLASNAHFWTGECYFKENKFRQAVLEYDKVINDYPESQKVPDAYLKMGMAFLKLGANEDAKLVFRKIVRDYPTTDAAKIAKKKLEELK